MILEYKISNWQIDKLREGLNNPSDEKLRQQCLSILMAIEHTPATEQEPVYIPSVWLEGEHNKAVEGQATSASTIDCETYP